MYDEILLTTDGSEGAEEAVDHAVEMAEKFNSKVHILYVVDVRSTSTHTASDVISDRLEEIGGEATDSIEKRLKKENIEVETHIERGIPHRNILDFSNENNIDLIIMSTHGRTGLDRILIGSVTEKVLRRSEVPVLTVGRE